MSLAGQAALLPVVILVLLAGAIAALVAGRLSGAAAGLVALATLVAAGVLLAITAPAVYRGHLLVHHLGGWAPLHGTVLAIGWAADPFGMTYALAATFLGAVIVAGAIVHLLGTERLSEMGGLARRHPVLAGAFVVGVASIIGVPPFNGYASRVLLHHAVAEQQEWVTLAALELAELLSAAALLRATWQAFFAPASPHCRAQPRRRLANTSAAGLVATAGGCLAFGLVPTRWLAGFAGPAAGVLTDPSRYARAVTSGTAVAVRFAPAHLPVSFVSVEVLASTAGVLVLGALAARWRLRAGADPAPIAALRRLHTGSVNDYATYWLLGAVVLAIAVTR